MNNYHLGNREGEGPSWEQAIKEPRDGVIHAASVGLAFALVENVEYAFFCSDIVAGTFHGIYISILSYDHFVAALFVDFIVLMISLRVLNFFNKTSPYKKSRSGIIKQRSRIYQEPA